MPLHTGFLEVALARANSGGSEGMTGVLCSHGLLHLRLHQVRYCQSSVDSHCPHSRFLGTRYYERDHRTGKTQEVLPPFATLITPPPGLPPDPLANRMLPPPPRLTRPTADQLAPPLSAATSQFPAPDSRLREKGQPLQRCCGSSC